MPVRIRYSCPHCGRRIVHHPELAGQLVICSVCKGEFYEPTDPLPGKAAERALEPLPAATRRLRVPEGNNPKHDLAILARRDSSDMRTITEIVEAVLLDDEPPAAPKPDETIADFGYQVPSSGKSGTERSPSPWDPPTSKPKRRERSAKPPASSVPSLPATPAPAAKTPSKPPQNVPVPSPVVPTLAGPAVRPLVPADSPVPTVVGSPQMLRSIPKPGIPGSSPTATKTPIPAPGLAGISIKAMVDELRRRGLGVVMVTCDMAPMRNHELAFSDNMTRDDAVALLRTYLDTLREPGEKPAGEGLLKRLWKGKESE